MDAIKQIIYREDDRVLMIVPNDLDIEIVPRTIDDLPARNLTVFNEMRDYLLTLIDSTEYIIYIAENKSLHLQSYNNAIRAYIYDELDAEKKSTLGSYMDAFYIMCEELLNN